MPKMSFWNQLVGSIMKIDYYSNFIKRSTGKAVLYLVLLTFIGSFLYGITVSLAWNEKVDMVREKIRTESPDFVFKNGEVTVKAPMPYVILKTNDTLLVVDTSGKSDESVLKGYEKGTFIGKNRIVDKKSSLETRSYDLSSIKELTFTKADVVSVMPWMKWFNILIVIVMFIYSIIVNLIAALLVGICGWIASKIMKIEMVFNDLYKISIYTLTLPLLLEMGRDLSGVVIPFFKVGFYIISIAYFVRVLALMKNNIITVDESEK
jgi:hypothetical protein